jgi:hypothetical protein
MLKKRLKSLLGLSKLKNPYVPTGFYKSTYDWMSSNNPKGSNSIKNYYELYQEEDIDRSKPKTIDSEMYWKFEIEYGNKTHLDFAVGLEGCRFWGGSAVITPDNKLLSDISIHMRVNPENPTKHPVFWKDIQPPETIEKSVAVLSAPGGNTYFHWMVDVLPRLHLIQEYVDQVGEEIDFFIVNSLSNKFQKQTLELLGIVGSKLIEVKNYPHISPTKLIAPSFIRHQTCNIGSWAFLFLRNHLIEVSRAKVGAMDTPKFLYVSRSKANSRQIKNEEQVYDVLKAKGFQRVFLEALNIEEQIVLFASSECIVAPHGAGLTNLLFCDEGTKVLEVYSPNYVSVSYWNISSQLGLDYYYLFGQGERPDKYFDPHKRGEDISVDIQSLEDTLALMEI